MLRDALSRALVGRRAFLRGLSLALAGFFTSDQMSPPPSSAAPIAGREIFLPDLYGGAASVLYVVRNITPPDFSQSNHHPGVESLLTLMGQNGLKFYRHSTTDTLSGPEGIIAADDVVLIKVNAQWKYRGCTNSDVLRGVIQRILDHPAGFNGEVMVIENGQGRGSFDCNQSRGYPDGSTHANAENEAHTFNYVCRTVFSGRPVSAYLLDAIRSIEVGANDHTTDGYRRIKPHSDHSWYISYPCLTSPKTGRRIELAKGIWNGSGYSQNLKLINLPVLKTHGGCGVTGALKLFYGVLSMNWADSGYHYNRIGQVLGEMFAHVRAPNLNIMDCIWVSHDSLDGHGSPRRLNTLVASLDPVALDYWCAKHVMYPIDWNPDHDPDRNTATSNLSTYLTEAMNEINACNPIGGKLTVRDEAHMILYEA